MKKTLLLFSVFCYTAAYAQRQGQARIDSLLQEMPKQKEDTNKVKLMCSIAFGYFSINPPEAIKLSKESLALSRKLKWKPGMATSLRNIGICHASLAEYSNSVDYFVQSLNIYTELKDKNGIASSYGNLGNIYISTGDYVRALENYLKALRAFEELKDKVGIARNLGNIGIIYKEQEDNNKALEYYNKALVMYEKMKDKFGMARNLGNIGNVYNTLKDFDKAVEYHRKALMLNTELNSLPGIALNNNNLGDDYYELKQLDKAENYFRISLSYCQQVNDKYGLAENYSKLGRINLEQAKTEKNSNRRTEHLQQAKKYSEDALKIHTEIHDLKNISYTQSALSEIYEINGDNRQALQLFRESVKNKDLYSGETVKKKIAALEKNREEDLKQKQIELLKSQNELETVKASRRTWFIIGLGIAFIVLVFVSISFYIQSKNRKKINKKLQRANINLNATQDQLVRQEKLASLGQLTAGIAHEIQNPLNFVNNFSEISAELVEDFTLAANENDRKVLAGQIKDNMNKIIHHGKKADAIVKNMLLHSRDKNAEKQVTDINTLCSEAKNIAYKSMQSNVHGFECIIAESPDLLMPMISVHPTDISRVFLNIFGNAFFAVYEKMKEENSYLRDYQPRVDVITKLSSDHINITIRDNGTGIPSEVLEKLFQPFFTTKPTGEGTGLGLSISYDIIKAHGGDIKVNSELGEYTEFIISLPA